MRTQRNFIGQKFGYWTVLDEAERGVGGNDRHPYWFCVCVCGNTKRILDTNLVRGLSKSCGKCNKKVSNF